MRRLLVLLAVVLLAASCGDDGEVLVTDDPQASGPSTVASVDGDWILTALIQDGVAATLPDNDLEMTIDRGELSWFWCNTFSGSIAAADDGTVTIGELAQTEMACPEFESIYAQAISAASAWEAESGGLTLRSETAEIRYAQAPPPEHQPLVGTVWNFDTIYEGTDTDGVASHRSDMDGVTLVVDGSQATVAGPGCSAPSMLIDAAAGTGGSFAVTERADIPDSPVCEVVLLAVEGLTAADGFRIDENRLTFVAGDMETVGFLAAPN